MMDLANPFREGLVLPHLSTVTNLSPEDREDIENFGSLLIGPRFYPHITITRLKNPEDAPRVISILGSKRQASFPVQSFILGHLGDHGTVKEVVERFEFSGNNFI